MDQLINGLFQLQHPTLLVGRGPPKTNKSTDSLFKAFITWCWFRPVSLISGLLHPAAASSTSSTTKSTMVKPENNTKGMIQYVLYLMLQYKLVHKRSHKEVDFSTGTTEKHRSPAVAVFQSISVSSSYLPLLALPLSLKNADFPRLLPKLL